MLKRESCIPFALRKANIVEHLGPVSRRFQMPLQRAADAAALRCVLASIYEGYDSMPTGSVEAQYVHARHQQLEGTFGRGAGTWLVGAPRGNPRFSRFLEFSDEAFRVAVLLRLGAGVKLLEPGECALDGLLGGFLKFLRPGCGLLGFQFLNRRCDVG